MDIRGTGRPVAVPGQYIVGFKPGTTAQQRADAVRSLAPQNTEQLDFVNAVLVDMPGSKALTGASIDSDRVAWVQPNYHHYLREETAADKPAANHGVQLTLPTVNDPDFAKQYHLDNTGQTGGTAGADVKAKAAWASATGEGVVVAIADTNVDITHPDIKNNVWVNPNEIAGNKIDDDHNGYVDDINGWNFGLDTPDVTKGSGTHGTHVAGIIGAVADNGINGVGIAPHVKLMPLGVLTNSATTANAIKAFEYAARNGANIINNSWGNNTYEPALQAAVSQATKAGMMVVVASGNENWDTGVHGSYPDNYAGSVSIAASDDKDAKASYSNRGTITIDVAAPGDNILSTLPGNSMGKKSGTSMASPVYAGIAALVKSKYPSLTMKQVETRIARSAQTTGTAAVWNGLVASGGRVDAQAALLPIATPVNPAPAGSAHNGPANPGEPAAQLPLPFPQPPMPAPRPNRPIARPIAIAGTPVKLAWGTDLPTAGQKYEVQASLNAGASVAVDDDFEGPAATRAFTTSGDAKWAIASGTAKSGDKSFQVAGLGRDKQSRLELNETITEPTELSFWYKGSRNGDLSFFVNRDLQFQPDSSEDWKQFTTTLQPGEYNFSWLATGRGTTAAPFAIDGLKIGKVSDAKWEPVGTTDADQTSIEWTPERATPGAQVRVRANNGRWAGDWVSGPAFEIRQ
jgi:subtilisin family serine protease